MSTLIILLEVIATKFAFRFHPQKSLPDSKCTTDPEPGICQMWHIIKEHDDEVEGKTDIQKGRGQIGFIR